MRNSTFRVRVIEAQNQIIELFARESRNLTLRCQRSPKTDPLFS
ncbi:hypothetical protein [Arsenophonus sp.]